MDQEDSLKHYNDDMNDIENEGLIDGKEIERYWSERNLSYKGPLLTKRVNTTSQIAIVGSNVCPIESLDYEIIENELFKQDWRSRKKVQIFQYIFLKWVFALLIGLGTGLVGFFNNIAVENIAGFKLLLTTNLMSKQEYFKAFLAYTGCNLGLATAAGSLCAFIAPAAAGSGIPEVKAYLNGIDAYTILAPSTLFVKIFGSILGVSAGFVVGKEGPMVHTGACIASLLGQGGSRKYHLTWKWLRYFKNDKDRRDLITCGAAAGVAAAFRAPVGGVLFALEEAQFQVMAQVLSLTRSPTTAVHCSSFTRLDPTTHRRNLHQSWISKSRNIKCKTRIICLFSDNRKQEQAKKALDSALGGKKIEFENWNKEIKKREEAGGGVDAGGGGWFGSGGWFGGSNGDHFWQEAQQASLAVLGIILMYLIIAKGEVMLAVILNPLLYALRGTRRGLTFITSQISQKLSPSSHASLENIPREEGHTHVSAKERVVRKWGSDY